MFVFLSLIAFFLHLFYALWQTYVLPVDVTINSIAMALNGMELLLAGSTIVRIRV